MQSILKEFLIKENIEFFESLPYDKNMELKYERKMPEWAKSILVFLIPYRVCGDMRNISEYAVARDYHFYIKELENKIFKVFAGKEVKIKVFSDNSPFFEREIAHKMGFGFFGKNHMFINDKYGSYIFIGEIICDFELNISNGSKTKYNQCKMCGACEKNCPAKCFSDGDFSKCMSALTQKKELTENEADLVSKHELVWGCDICQDVCPHNKNVSDTPIEFFKQNRICILDEKTLSEMTEEEFQKRAFSWRGKSVIERNLKLHNLF